MDQGPAIQESARIQRQESMRLLLVDIARWRKMKQAEMQLNEKVEALQAFIDGGQHELFRRRV